MLLRKSITLNDTQSLLAMNRRYALETFIGGEERARGIRMKYVSSPQPPIPEARSPRFHLDRADESSSIAHTLVSTRLSAYDAIVASS